jgi:hypothetical protein
MTDELGGLADRDGIEITEATHQYNRDGWIVRLAMRDTSRCDAEGITRQMPYVGAARPKVVEILRQQLDFAAEVEPGYEKRTSRLPKLAAGVDPFLVFTQARTDMRMLLGDCYGRYMRAAGH